MRKISAGLPHGLAFVSDPQAGEPPEPGSDTELVWANRECLMIKCTHIQEGETNIALSSDPVDAMPQMPIYDDVLSTPSRLVQIWTSRHGVRHRRRRQQAQGFPQLYGGAQRVRQLG